MVTVRISLFLSINLSPYICLYYPLHWAGTPTYIKSPHRADVIPCRYMNTYIYIYIYSFPYLLIKTIQHRR